MIEHMQLGDMPKFCESVKTWLSDCYGARLINAKKDNQNAERRSMKLRKTKTAFW